MTLINIKDAFDKLIRNNQDNICNLPQLIKLWEIYLFN